ncbi:type III secretion system gatekeeper subunit SctW [Pseudomonas typographi]|uniref:Type III secretion system gatekeeper subunit SctW n=1 Tax=Pseudomonas typographi TaxID=2715964 RepID=A0ABR7Z2B8_9PSED|nr:type III secretion system gatekeeper subunit SctW [Pseudomonas typographi]MBD1552381.1 type III secretion system gatekeeper subunit SctW [Pseudomonas typographi]MBD1587224.1 type III secretion system gatekeeper subunit SctW [Pseudomonas typographi]MBD1599538.1 type III secretion system gatekeeper subunit SctW [Pseudomonas typographi]
MAIVGGIFTPPRPASFKAPELTAKEQQLQQGQLDGPDDDRAPAALVAQFAQSSDEMAASLRAQFRRRADLGDKLETLGDAFERVLEDNAVPKAMQVLKLAGQTGRTIEWLLQQARQQFPDESDLVLVLKELLQRGNMPQATQQRLNALLVAVLAQAAPKRLKAGINVALKARLFGKRLRLRAALMRETYRAFLESDDDPVGCYEDWIALYGEEHRGNILDFVETALLTDIDAVDPSCSRLEFGPLMSRLGEIKQLRSADLNFVTYLLGQAPVRQYNAKEADWLVFMLGLLRYPDEVTQLLGEVFGQSLLLAEARDRGAALQYVRAAACSLPPGLFGDDEALSRVAEQFSDLASTVHRQESIDRHAATHRYQTLKGPGN